MTGPLDPGSGLPGAGPPVAARGGAAGSGGGGGPVVVVAGGGTAGHVEPALATADAVLRLSPGSRVVAVGTERGLETRLVPARGHELRLVPPVPLPRRLTPQLLAVPGKVRAAVSAAGTVLDEVGADVVVGFGGYVCVPVYLAARRRGTPLVVHEANARPGLANRLGAALTRHVLVTVPGTRLRGAEVVGLPLRPAVATLDRPTARATAREGFGLEPDRPVLLVFGGSQGAASLNRAVQDAAPALRRAGVQVLHVTGQAHAETVAAALPTPAPGDPPHVVVPYVDQMEQAYAAADLAVCRAGAMTVAELTAVGLPAVYVPLPIGNGEQALNAGPVVGAGGGRMLPDGELTGDRLVDEATALLADPSTLDRASRAAAALGHRGADEEVARRVLGAARAVRVAS